MKRLFLFLALLLWAGYAQAATPTRVQHASFGSTKGLAQTSYVIRFANGTQAGNCIVLALTIGSGSGATVTPSDDKTNTYTLAKNNVHAGGQDISVYTAPNVASGTRVITVTFTVASPTFVMAAADEFSNVATTSPVDVTTGNTGSSTSVTAGSFTPTASGELLYHVGVQDSVSTSITSWTQGASPWAFLSANRFDSMAIQYQVQVTAAAINPTMTQAPANNFNSVAIALKSATAGSAAPAGIFIGSSQHNDVVESDASPFTIHAPTTGNLLVLAIISFAGEAATAITDSSSNTWTQPACSPKTNGGSGDVQIWYAVNATTSTTLNITITKPSSGGTGTNTYVLYDVSGAASSPFDNCQSATGNQTVAGNFNGVAITPAILNGVVTTDIGVNTPRMTAVSPALFNDVIPHPGAGTTICDENNGWGHEYNTTTSARTYVWSDDGTAVLAWASLAAAFKAPAAGGTVHQLTTLGVGN